MHFFSCLFGASGSCSCFFLYTPVVPVTIHSGHATPSDPESVQKSSQNRPSLPHHRDSFRATPWTRRWHPLAPLCPQSVAATVSITIAVFPILADVVEVKTRSLSTAHWRIHFIRLNAWLRHSFAQLITLLDIDGIGQNWEDSNKIHNESPTKQPLSQRANESRFRSAPLGPQRSPTKTDTKADFDELQPVSRDQGVMSRGTSRLRTHEFDRSRLELG